MTHFRVQYWHGVRAKLLRTEHWDPEYIAGKHQEMTAITMARHNGEEWHFMIQPHQDLFCLDPQDMLTVNWNYFIRDLPFSSPMRGYGGLCHVAVEFDPSWNFKLRNQNDFNNLLEESTARGFVARTIAACARYDLHSFIWLIDRGICRSTAKRATEPIVFHDCDRTYVETKPQDLELQKLNYRSTALYFVDRLADIGDSAYSRMEFEDEGSEIEENFAVEDHLGVLSCI
jgi:hypothetical protein